MTYDLTDKVSAFLDPKLAAQIEFFNENGKKQDLGMIPVNTIHVDTAEPSLEAAHKLYECNNFPAAFGVLSRCNFAVGTEEQENAAWARLVCKLLTDSNAAAEESASGASTDAETPAVDDSEVQEFDNARSELLRDPLLKEVLGVRDVIEQRRSLPGAQLLNKRVWIIHWSLFAYFSGNRYQHLPDRLFSSMAMSVIQSSCPWILRYVAVAVVVLHSPTSRYNRRVKDLVRALQQESYEYKDAVTDLVLTLYSEGDFDDLSTKLEEARKLLEQDFFASYLANDFVEKFRILAADMYFKVHQKVNRKDLYQVLGISESDEKWLEQYISFKNEAKLDTSYDASTGIAHVALVKPSIQNLVADKVKHLDQKTKQIAQEV